MRLEKAGAIKVFTDVMSGKSMERPGLADLIAYARKGDTLAVVRLDRLGRSLPNCSPRSRRCAAKASRS
jgi:DNA invertase Pin-like site-specific DNA recombinase